jgi:hypothetical protein
MRHGRDCGWGRVGIALDDGRPGGLVSKTTARGWSRWVMDDGQRLSKCTETMCLLVYDIWIALERGLWAYAYSGASLRCNILSSFNGEFVILPAAVFPRRCEATSLSRSRRLQNQHDSTPSLSTRPLNLHATLRNAKYKPRIHPNPPTLEPPSPHNIPPRLSLRLGLLNTDPRPKPPDFHPLDA